MSHPTVHLVNHLNGHDMSVQCWCEPAKIYWIKTKLGVEVMVVEHEDYNDKHREVQLAERRAGLPPEIAWIDRALDGQAPTAPVERDIKARKRPEPPAEGPRFFPYPTNPQE